jgi:hypothetical protein
MPGLGSGKDMPGQGLTIHRAVRPEKLFRKVLAQSLPGRLSRRHYLAGDGITIQDRQTGLPHQGGNRAFA